jgi:protein-L-isoaspartate(D-aspartate) O-methyltransferase
MSKASEFDRRRAAMVEHQLLARDISDPAVLRAMDRVPRHEFVPRRLRNQAYADGPLAIGNGQTISQPYIVALMTQLAKPEFDSRVLDVGTGSGYQAAVLAEIVKHVDSLEIVEGLADEARDRLKRLEYENVTVYTGDGYRGLSENAPYDLILVAAAPDHLPEPLIDQLAVGGRLVIPVGDFHQKLTVVEKQADGSIEKRFVAPVAFVPMTGLAQKT